MRHKLFCHFCVCAAFALSALLVACLDIPSSPDTQDKIERVEVFVRQRSTLDSTDLKINSNEPATLVARIFPSKHQNEVLFTWYKDNEEKEKGSVFTVTANQLQFNNLFFPNRLVVSDNSGNSIEKKFTVVVNAPPILRNIISPVEGDTLYGSEHTPFTFEWRSYDKDKGQPLFHILEIDGIKYSVGEFTQVKQSGFVEGPHTYRVFVSDAFNDKDSSEIHTFFVKNNSGDNQ